MALAHERRAPVLFHAGRGIPHLGEAVVDLARRYPGARLILAHAGHQRPRLDRRRGGRAAEPLLRHRVVERRRPAAALRDDPARAGSSTRATCPTAPGLLAAFVFLRVRARGRATAPEALRAIAGGQLARVVAGRGPARPRARRRAPTRVGPRVIEAERVVTYCAAGAADRLPRHGPVRADRAGAAGVPDVPRRRRPRAAELRRRAAGHRPGERRRRTPTCRFAIDARRAAGDGRSRARRRPALPAVAV